MEFFGQMHSSILFSDQLKLCFHNKNPSNSSWSKWYWQIARNLGIGGKDCNPKNRKLEEFVESSPDKTFATALKDHMEYKDYTVKEAINLIDRTILGLTSQFVSCICTLDSEAGRKSDGVKKHYPGKIQRGIC